MQAVRLAILVGVISALASGGLNGQSYSPGQSFSTQRQPSQSQAGPTAAAQRASQTPTEVQQRAGAKAPQSMYNLATPTSQVAQRSTPRPTSRKASSSPKARSTPAGKAKTIAEKDSRPHVTPVPKSDSPAGVTARPGAKYLTAWPTGQKLIALTYDDGPDARYTPKLLDYLAEARVPATFYICGNRVESAPEVLARIAQEGHEIANHTWDHPLLTKLSPEKIREQLTSTEEAVQSAAPGTKMTTMRPPFGGGVGTAKLQDICKELGYKIVLWDIDTEDWRKRPAQQMINNILKNASDGSIVLMHDRLHGGQDTVLPTTRAVVEALRERGFTFVRVDDLLSRPHKSTTSQVATSTSGTISAAASIRMEESAPTDADQR